MGGGGGGELNKKTLLSLGVFVVVVLMTIEYDAHARQ